MLLNQGYNGHQELASVFPWLVLCVADFSMMPLSSTSEVLPPPFTPLCFGPSSLILRTECGSLERLRTL